MRSLVSVTLFFAPKNNLVRNDGSLLKHANIGLGLIRLVDLEMLGAEGSICDIFQVPRNRRRNSA